MEYDLRLLRAFVAVAELGSFSKAAARLGVTQSSLSLQIQRLERSLGIMLFKRTTRSVLITAEGAALVDSARVVIERLEMMRLDIRRMRMATAKELHVGAAIFTLDIPERNALLEGFAKIRPEVQLRVHDALQPELIAAIANGRIEIAIVLGSAHNSRQPDHASPAGTYPSDLCAAVLGTRQIGLLIPRESSLARHERIEPAMLAGREILMIDADQHPAMHAELIDVLASVDARPIYHFESCHALAVERFAAQRRLPCISLGWFRPDPDSHMVHRPLVRPDWRMALAVLSARELSPMAQAFVDFAVTEPREYAHDNI